MRGAAFCKLQGAGLARRQAEATLRQGDQECGWIAHCIIAARHSYPARWNFAARGESHNDANALLPAASIRRSECR